MSHVDVAASEIQRDISWQITRYIFVFVLVLVVVLFLLLSVMIVIVVVILVVVAFVVVVVVSRVDMVYAAVAADDIQSDISLQVRMGCFCSLRFRVSVISGIFINVIIVIIIIIARRYGPRRRRRRFSV